MSLKDLFRFPAARLSRRIALWVFFCVILIETLIFIPSYNKREKELLSQLKDISVARVAMIMDIVRPDASDDELFEEIKKLQKDEIVIGGALFTANGRKIGEFGEIPGLPVQDPDVGGSIPLLAFPGCAEAGPVEYKEAAVGAFGRVPALVHFHR